MGKGIEKEKSKSKREEIREREERERERERRGGIDRREREERERERRGGIDRRERERKMEQNPIVMKYREAGFNADSVNYAEILAYYNVGFKDNATLAYSYAKMFNFKTNPGDLYKYHLAFGDNIDVATKYANKFKGYFAQSSAGAYFKIFGDNVDEAYNWYKEFKDVDWNDKLGVTREEHINAVVGALYECFGVGGSTKAAECFRMIERMPGEDLDNGKKFRNIVETAVKNYRYWISSGWNKDLAMWAMSNGFSAEELTKNLLGADTRASWTKNLEEGKKVLIDWRSGRIEAKADIAANKRAEAEKDVYANVFGKSDDPIALKWKRWFGKQGIQVIESLIKKIMKNQSKSKEEAITCIENYNTWVTSGWNADLARWAMVRGFSSEKLIENLPGADGSASWTKKLKDGKRVLTDWQANKRLEQNEGSDTWKDVWKDGRAPKTEIWFEKHGLTAEDVKNFYTWGKNSNNLTNVFISRFLRKPKETQGTEPNQKTTMKISNCLKELWKENGVDITQNGGAKQNVYQQRAKVLYDFLKTSKTGDWFIHTYWKKGKKAKSTEKLYDKRKIIYNDLLEALTK